MDAEMKEMKEAGVSDEDGEEDEKRMNIWLVAERFDLITGRNNDYFLHWWDGEDVTSKLYFDC